MVSIWSAINLRGTCHTWSIAWNFGQKLIYERTGVPLKILSCRQRAATLTSKIERKSFISSSYWNSIALRAKWRHIWPLTYRILINICLTWIDYLQLIKLHLIDSVLHRYRTFCVLNIHLAVIFSSITINLTMPLELWTRKTKLLRFSKTLSASNIIE